MKSTRRSLCFVFILLDDGETALLRVLLLVYSFSPWNQGKRTTTNDAWFVGIYFRHPYRIECERIIRYLLMVCAFICISFRKLKYNLNAHFFLSVVTIPSCTLNQRFYVISLLQWLESFSNPFAELNGIGFLSLYQWWEMDMDAKAVSERVSCIPLIHLYDFTLFICSALRSSNAAVHLNHPFC
jgi:hypothetical protein